MNEPWLTVSQAAEVLQVHPETVRLWLREGKLLGTLINRRAGYRIAQSEIDRFLREGPREGRTEKLAA